MSNPNPTYDAPGSASQSDQNGSDVQTSTIVAPNDATPVAFPKGIFVGTGGTIVGRLLNDTADRTWKNIPSGTRLCGSWILVKAAGTTAADMLGLS